MYSRVYEFFRRFWYRRSLEDAIPISGSDTPVHTCIDDDLDTSPNSCVDILDEGQDWIDLSVVDSKGQREAIKQEETKVVEKAPPKVSFQEAIQMNTVVVTETKKKRRKKR